VPPETNTAGWYVVPRPLRWIGPCVDLRRAIRGPVSRFAADGYALDHEFMGGHKPAIVHVEGSPILAGYGRATNHPR